MMLNPMGMVHQGEIIRLRHEIAELIARNNELELEMDITKCPNCSNCIKNLREEVAFWKNRAESFRKELEELKNGL